MLRRFLSVLLILMTLCLPACAEQWQIPEIDIGPCSVSVTAELVEGDLLQVTVLPLKREADTVLPEAFVLYAEGENVGVAYAGEGGGWLGYAPLIGDTLIVVPVFDGQEYSDGVIFLGTL